MVGLLRSVKGRDWENQNPNEVIDLCLVAAKITEMNKTWSYAQEVHNLVGETEPFQIILEQCGK